MRFDRLFLLAAVLFFALSASIDRFGLYRPVWGVLWTVGALAALLTAGLAGAEALWRLCKR